MRRGIVPAEFEWRVVGDDHTWQSLRAFDAEAAAELAAEAYDRDGGGSLVDAPEAFLKIEVRPRGGAEITRWSVRAEASVSYYARAL